MSCLNCKGTPIDVCYEPQVSDQQLDMLRSMIKCLCKCEDTPTGVPPNPEPIPDDSVDVVANKYVLPGYASAGTYTLDARDIMLSVRINGEKSTRRIPASLFEADGGFSPLELLMTIYDVLGIPTEGLFYYMQGMRDGFFDDTSMKYRFSISVGGTLEPPYYSEEQLSGNPEDLLIEGFDKTGFDIHLSLLEMVMGQPIPSENKPIWNPESYEIEIFPTPYDELPSMTLDFISIINEMVGSEINSINLKSEGWIDYTPLAPFLS